jgi:hypothetical protein
LGELRSCSGYLQNQESTGARVDGGLRTSQGRLSIHGSGISLPGNFSPRQLLMLLLLSPVAAVVCGVVSSGRVGGLQMLTLQLLQVWIAVVR